MPQVHTLNDLQCLILYTAVKMCCFDSNAFMYEIKKHVCSKKWCLRFRNAYRRYSMEGTAAPRNFYATFRALSAEKKK